MALSPFYFNEFYRPSRLLDQHFGLAFTPEDLMLPAYDTFPNYYRPWRTPAEETGSTITKEKDKFRICLDVQQFKPNEITVKTTAKQVTVEGKHEERQDEHGFIARQFIRKYSIPDDYDSDDVNSSLTADGILIIEAKKKISRAMADKERVVPIDRIAAICQKSTGKKDTAQNIKESALKMETMSKVKDENGATMAQFEQNGKMEKIKEEALMKSENSSQLKESIKDDYKMKASAAKEERCSLLNADGTLKFSSDITSEATRAARNSSIQERMDFSSSSVSSEVMQSKESSFSSTEMSRGFRSGGQASDFISDIINAELKQSSDNL